MLFRSQPALLLVTNILNSNHPTWTAILDLYSRRPVDPSRILADTGTTPKPKTLYAVFDQFSSPPASAKVEYLRKNTTLDVAAAAAHHLEQRLHLELTSAFLHEGQTVKSGRKGPAWGQTIDTQGQGDAYTDTDIYIQLASEMLWPLLVPAYTRAEKATSSAMIANVLLHELAVRRPRLPAGSPLMFYTACCANGCGIPLSRPRDRI